MGQAKRKGSFAQRKAQALNRQRIDREIEGQNTSDVIVAVPCPTMPSLIMTALAMSGYYAFSRRGY